MSAAIIWFRQDLRLGDNQAVAAARQARPVIPLYIWAPQEEGDWPPGAASRWWLHHSLIALDRELRTRGSRLIIRQGDSLDVLKEVVAATGADPVLWNRRYEPAAIDRDANVQKELTSGGVECEVFNGSLLFDVAGIKNRAGGPFQVFSAFWNACQSLESPARPLSTPRVLAAPRRWPKSLTIESLELLPKIDWAKGITAAWTPGEQAAEHRLRRFIRKGLDRYQEDRDRPDLPGTSQLSPYLHWGEISPRRVWHAVRDHLERRGHRVAGEGASAFLRELGWREFAHHLLVHFPHTPEEPLREQFANVPWEQDERLLRAWQRGRTGYAFVDAGMRQLWRIGWMHNRVRMAVASFLTKDLLISWQTGSKWFWETLVDADLANNTLGWQWTAGCGADAAPYFRVFNPVSQGRKFDPRGDYVREYVPEFRHAREGRPGQQGEEAAKIVPVVEHHAARRRYLARMIEGLPSTRRQ